MRWHSREKVVCALAQCHIKCFHLAVEKSFSILLEIPGIELMQPWIALTIKPYIHINLPKCCQFRVMPEIVSKLVCTTKKKNGQVIDSDLLQILIWYMLICSYALILLLVRSQWMIKRLSKAMSSVFLKETTWNSH